MQYIRNFSIIAHIDHGKSTLSDRFIQICGGLNDREMRSQVLDSMDLERERGITIKSQSVTLTYKSQNNVKVYQLNLIDTPGHVDFMYEVSRSLAACEGAILVIDASQGVQAQTIANYRIAMEMNLKVITVLNKIDLSTLNSHRMFEEIKNILDVDKKDIILCSAKTGLGVVSILERVIRDIPVPKGNIYAPLQALIIDSWFNNYVGVTSLVCIKNGMMHCGNVLQSMTTGQTYIIDKLGIFTPKPVFRTSLKCGEVGWVVYTRKGISGASVGDTLTLLSNPAEYALPSFKQAQSYIYAGLFPVESITQKSFSDALYKLSLNDSSLCYKPERSEYFGLGFRCGFLGLLHMEIIQERLKREYLIDIIITNPRVVYKVLTVDDQVIFVDSPVKLMSISNVKQIYEPFVLCTLLFPQEYLGSIMNMCVEKRGIHISLYYKENNKVILIYELPMSEIISDFFDYIKSVSKGYATFEYKFNRFVVSDVVCLKILINRKCVDELAMIVHRSAVGRRSRVLVDKLQLLIPRQQFDISIQASVGNRIICRNTVKQLRKNVTYRCYGGDITRKKKLLYNQKIGKKRLKQRGRVYLPNTVFLSILNRNCS